MVKNLNKDELTQVSGGDFWSNLKDGACKDSCNCPPPPTCPKCECSCSLPVCTCPTCPGISEIEKLYRDKMASLPSGSVRKVVINFVTNNGTLLSVDYTPQYI